jgi:hypothetical protein
MSVAGVKNYIVVLCMLLKRSGGLKLPQVLDQFMEVSKHNFFNASFMEFLLRYGFGVWVWVRFFRNNDEMVEPTIYNNDD